MSVSPTPRLGAPAWDETLVIVADEENGDAEQVQVWEGNHGNATSEVARVIMFARVRRVEIKKKINQCAVRCSNFSSFVKN